MAFQQVAISHEQVVVIYHVKWIRFKGHLLHDRYIDIFCYHSLDLLGLWLQLESATEVTDLRNTLFEHEYVQGLQVSVHDIFRVEVLKAKAKIYKYLPQEIVNKWLARDLLFLDQGVEITHWAILKDYIDLLSVNEAIKVSHDV
jgi:hypothetical protein